MSWDFHPVENEQALADMKPLAGIEPGFFSGMQWAPYQINRGFAVAGRALSLATSTPFILADKIRGGTELQDRYFHDVHETIYQRAVDFWTPNPKEVGTAARVVGDLISTLPMAMAAPPLAILSAQMGTAEELVRAGVPEGKAQAVSAIQGAGMGLGIWMPILGKNLWQRTVVGGAGFNTLQGVVTRGASGAILEGTPAKDQFKAFDGEAMTLDVLLGLGFGAFTHINPEARAQGAKAWDNIAKWAERFSPSQKAAIATLREAQHLNVDSTPGKPVGHADIEAHVNRLRAAMDQLANDKPVQVEDMPAPKMEPDPVREQENIQRTADMINIAERIREEEGIPTPDKSSISQGLPHNGMQERPEVRADESGSLEEPAQSGSGAGNATNPNDIPARVLEAVLKAVNKVQDANRKWAMEHEIRDEVVNTGAVSIKDLLKKERAEIQISEVTGLERTRFGWTASVRGEKITVPGSYSKKTAPQAIADAYAISHEKVIDSDLIDPETGELTDAGFEALNKATDAEIEARANAAFGKIESLDELNSVDHRTQWEAMKALVGQFGLDSKTDASSGGSRYLTVEIGGESYKIRFADHFNTVRDSTMQPDFNVAPGRNTFTDAVEWLMGKLNVTQPDEVRGVMDRMLDSQAAHPSEPPRAPAEGAGTPPPGKVGEAPAARSDLDQALAEGKPNLTAPRGLEHPDIRETLQHMAANETGWAEVGGRMLRIPDASMESGERIDRTKWIPKAEWWAARPGPKRLNEAQVQEAVRKALAGEPMNAAEKRTVEFMLEVANDRLDSVQQIGEERFGEMLEDAQLEDLPPTTENAFDSMTARRAYDLDLEAYEAAVDRYNVHEDDGLFMAEVRSIIHEAEQQRGAGSQDHPGGAAERGARPGEADPAAESAGQRSAPRDYVSTEAERIATDNPERRVHVGLDADGKPLTVTAREFLDNARKEADRISQDANLFQIAGECLLSQL